MLANPTSNSYVVSGLAENKRREDLLRFGGADMAAALGAGMDGLQMPAGMTQADLERFVRQQAAAQGGGGGGDDDDLRA